MKNIDINNEIYTKLLDKKSKKYIIILSIIFFVVISVIIVTKIFILTPKNIFLYALNNSYHNLSNKIALDNNLLKYKTINTNTNLNVNYSTGNSITDYILDSSAINNFDINIESEIDIKNQNFNDKLSLINNEDKLELEVAKNDDSLYILSSDIFDKYIKLSFDNINNYTWLSNLINIDKEDLNYFVNEFKDNYLLKLTDEDFNMIKEKVNVNDEEINANKILYTITENEFDNILKETIENLEKDSNIINNEQLKLLINNIKQIYDNKENSNKTYIFSVYTIGLMQDSVKYSLEIISGDNSYVINYSDYANVYYLNFVNNNNFLSISIRNINKNDYQVSIEFDDYKLDSTINIINNDINIDYKLQNVSDTVSGNIKIDQKAESDNYSSGKLTLNISIDSDDVDLLKIKINGDYENYFNQELSEMDLTNNININDLTDEEISNIMIEIDNDKILKLFKA